MDIESACQRLTELQEERQRLDEEGRKISDAIEESVRQRFKEPTN